MLIIYALGLFNRINFNIVNKICGIKFNSANPLPIIELSSINTADHFT
jgi:hypothetical protein